MMCALRSNGENAQFPFYNRQQIQPFSTIQISQERNANIQFRQVKTECMYSPIWRIKSRKERVLNVSKLYWKQIL